jgi:hypothetical protein
VKPATTTALKLEIPMTRLHRGSMSRPVLLASSLALAAAACTIGVRENTRTVTATGPDAGWTVLTFQSSAANLPRIHVTSSTESVPTASAALTFLDPAGGTLAASEAALQGSGLSFGEPVVSQGADATLPLTLSMPATAEELPSIRSLDITVPHALGVDIDVQNAPVDVSWLEGPVSVNTTNASVGIGKNDGNLTVATTNGSVSGAVGGGKVTTNNGDVKLDWAVVAGLDVRTSNATVTVTVPADAGVTAFLQTSDGTITVFGQTYPSPYNGPLGGKGLIILTTNGNITLK